MSSHRVRWQGCCPNKDRRSKHDVMAHARRRSLRPLVVGEPWGRTSIPGHPGLSGQWGLRSGSSIAALTGVPF